MKNTKTKITILVLATFLLSASVTFAAIKRDIFQEIYNDLFAKISTASGDIDIYKVSDPESGAICFVSYTKPGVGQASNHQLSCIK